MSQIMVTAGMSPTETNVRILLTLGVIVASARGGGWVLSRIRQPRVHGEILAGILLGPSLLGLIAPSVFEYAFPPEVIQSLRVLAQIGLVLFMFQIGLDIEIDKLRSISRQAVVVSVASIVAPFGLGTLLAAWLYPRLGGHVDALAFSLFFGAAMAVTAFPVLARVLHETGLTRTHVGTLSLACAAVDDVTAWCLLAVVLAVSRASSLFGTVWQVALLIGYLLLMTGVVRPLLSRVRAVPLWAAICLTLASAWATEQIGVHAIFGAFLAGIAMPRHSEVHGEVRQRLEGATMPILLPTFFLIVGLSTRVSLLDSAWLWGIAVVVIIVAVAGKFGGAALAARATGQTWSDAAALGLLVNTRGLTELVILTAGLDAGVISPTIFTIMVMMALTTTLMATPLLVRLLPTFLDSEWAGASDRGSR